MCLRTEHYSHVKWENILEKEKSMCWSAGTVGLLLSATTCHLSENGLWRTSTAQMKRMKGCLPTEIDYTKSEVCFSEGGFSETPGSQMRYMQAYSWNQRLSIMLWHATVWAWWKRAFLEVQQIWRISLSGTLDKHREWLCTAPKWILSFYGNFVWVASGHSFVLFSHLSILVYVVHGWRVYYLFSYVFIWYIIIEEMFF